MVELRVKEGGIEVALQSFEAEALFKAEFGRPARFGLDAWAWEDLEGSRGGGAEAFGDGWEAVALGPGGAEMAAFGQFVVTA